MPARTSGPAGAPRDPRISRIFRLLRIIAGGEAYTTPELSRLTGVSQRTVFRDLRAMQAAGIPLRYEATGGGRAGSDVGAVGSAGESAGAGGYRLRRGGLGLPVSLSEEESLALVGLLGQWAKTAKIPMLATAQKALEKIRGQLSAEALRKLQAVEERFSFRLAGGEDGRQCQDICNLLEEALRKRRIARCRYEALSGSQTRASRDNDPLGRRLEAFDFKPYGLFWHRGASYVVGYHAGREALRMLRLSRFESVELTRMPYRIPEGFSLKGFLGNAWGILRGEKSYAVELRFRGPMACIVEESQWHATQETQRNADGSLTFTCCVDGLDEIARWALSMGPSCQVIAPAALREEIQRLASETLAVYRQ